MRRSKASIGLDGWSEPGKRLATRLLPLRQLPSRLLPSGHRVALSLRIAQWLLIARRLLLATLLLLTANVAQAAGPRWVTGPPYFTSAGTWVGWYTLNPLYFTDPGDLSSTVNHAAADALVAAAAGVWNVPTASITLAQGGTLAEHVSGANAYLSSNGPVFPSDVQSSNYASIQIAVIYDSDGSVTDMLLGSGASTPAECRQNGVTESVDSITTSGLIQHAILVLNGRCTASAPAAQLQLQYQLQRAFGRVLGLGWSQTNDNVFTSNPAPSHNQALHWPILHPIDIVCGLYTYQCLPEPFKLRDDDVASISGLYRMYVYGQIPSTPPAAGKIWTYTQASFADGQVTFPSGQGMQGVNMLLQRREGSRGDSELWYDVSSVTGYQHQRNAGNPVTGAVSGIANSMGSNDAGSEGFYEMAWVPDIDAANSSFAGAMTAYLTSEPVNPLYSGAYSVGPYVAGAVEPSGSPITQHVASQWFQINQYAWDPVVTDFTISDAATNCNTSGDGVETAPATVASSGWWTDVLCANGHAAWSSFNSRANRTATIEVTALDESSLATTQKAMPLIGVWNATDATGTLPTVAATPSAFNTTSLGMTATSLTTTTAEQLRFVIADTRGNGRPDFAYKARVLYADSIVPTTVSSNGGLIMISGMGFRAGNEVTVNGVIATVTSWSSTTITATAPADSAFTSKPTGPVDVAVIDLSTKGTTVMTGALTYSSGVTPDQMTLVSAPSGTVLVGTTAATPFAVRVFLSNGVTPVAGVPVTFTPSGGAASFGACAASPCVVVTDATGLASTTVTPTAYGTVTLLASALGASQTASFNAVVHTMTILQADQFIAAGATATWTPQVNVAQNGAAASGITVTWTASSGMSVAPSTSLTSATGVAQIAAVTGPLAAGALATGTACAWTTICASFTAEGVAASAWRVVIDSGAGQSVTSPTAFAPLVAMVTDVSGDPVASSPVTIYQMVTAAAMACPAHGRCPAAPRLAKSSSTATSDAYGLVSVTPTQLAGVGEVTNLAVVTGTQGFAALAISQAP